MKPSHFSVNPY